MLLDDAGSAFDLIETLMGIVAVVVIGLLAGAMAAMGSPDDGDAPDDDRDE